MPRQRGQVAAARCQRRPLRSDPTPASVGVRSAAFELLEEILTLQFKRKGPAAVAENVGVARAGYDHAAAHFTAFPFSLPDSGKRLAFFEGNQALAMGGAAAGCYQHPRVPKLRYAVNDARAVQAVLQAQGFKPERVVTLFDRQATRSAIERVLGDDLRTKVGRNDRVFVFFAGHGKADRLASGEDEGYLIPVDGDPSALYSTAISMEGLRRLSDRIPAKHVLYVVDACYSGYAVYNRAISDDLLDEMMRKPAIQILTAGRQGDEAQERNGHGVFTEVLLRDVHEPGAGRCR